jgi:UDPglucose--hexose-1-phosphate uridylyltransferase
VIERNPITGDPILVAPDRGGRPNLYLQEGVCPFCPGNERLTPPEIARIGDPWQVRAFPNKYPATDMHEVIVETPRHESDIDPRAVDLYVDRYRALSAKAEHVTIFKNHGPMAGASIPHPHSQIIGTPFIPPRIEREAAAFKSTCPLCAIDAVRETDHYRTVEPKGAMFADERWIVPKKHAPAISEAYELGELLNAAARTIGSDSFNWIFLNFPAESRAHWYVQIFPRFAPHAGYELGSGSAIRTR